MRHATIVGVFTLMLMLAPGLVFAEPVINDSKTPQYLFTLSAKSGTLDGDTLTLKEVPLVVYFSDRPNRIAGHVTLEKFIEMWDKGVDSFKVDPPDAELAIYDESGDKHGVLIISAPVVKGDSISFRVRVFAESVPESFGHATLFIDSFIIMTGGGPGA